MSDLALIRETLNRAAARRRLQRALHGLWVGLLAGTALWLLVLAIFKVLPLPTMLVEWGWLGSLAGALVGALAGGWRAVPLSAAARILEGRETLAQRLSTALEFADRPATAETDWTRLLLTDAASCLRRVDPRRLLPLGLPKLARWIPVLLIAVIGLGWVPEYRSAAFRQKKKEAEILRDTGRKLAELIRREQEQRVPVAEPVREALEDAALLGERLSRAKLTKADAIRDLASATRRLEEEARELDSNPALRRMQQAARSPSGNGPTDGSAQQKQMEQLQKSLAGATPEGLEKLAQQLQKAQQAAAGLQQGANPDAAAQQALEQALDELAQNAASLGLSLAGLNDALEAMKNLDADRLLRDLQLAGAELEKLRELAQKLSQMQQSMKEMGKDLAEQLERGQAEEAAKTLDRMVEQLRSPGLTPEQRKQMLREVAEALKPAGDYGKVAEMLKAASQQMASDRDSDAARNLAKAAAALRDLAKQAQDLDQLAETLAAFQDAQLALKNDKFWQPGGT